MNFDTTLYSLKKRIFQLLDEYSTSSDVVYVADSDKNFLQSKLPDAVNSAVLQMYESLPIGSCRSEVRLCRPVIIAYDKGFPQGEKECASLYIPKCSLIIYFKYFGSGSIVFENDKNEVVCSIQLNGDESLKEARKSVLLPEDGNYFVYADDGISVRDFTIYEDDGRTKQELCCQKGKASLELPENFGKILFAFADGHPIDKELIEVCDGFAYLPTSECENASSVVFHYRKAVPVIDEATPESFVFDLAPLEFEALICLSASFLCREQDAGKHTRLVYRYNDLCEGLKAVTSFEKRRNSFYKMTEKRW